MAPFSDDTASPENIITVSTFIYKKKFSKQMFDLKRSCRIVVSFIFFKHRYREISKEKSLLKDTSTIVRKLFVISPFYYNNQEALPLSELKNIQVSDTNSFISCLSYPLLCSIFFVPVISFFK